MPTQHYEIANARRPPAEFEPTSIGRLDLELQLADVRSTGGTLKDLTQAIATLTGSLAYLLDPDERIIARAVPPHGALSPIPRLERLLTAIGSGGEPPVSAAVIPGDAHKWPHRRYCLAPVTHNGHLFAYLVLADNISHGSEQKGELVWIADRGATHLRGEFLAQRRLASVAWNARANLGRQMIRSTTYDADLRACAEYLGVDLTADRIIVFILERGRPSDSTVDAGRIADLMEADLNTEILPIRGSEGVLLAVQVQQGGNQAMLLDWIKDAVVGGLERMGDNYAVAGLSPVTSARQLRRAYREAREAARCIDRYGSRETRAVSCDELGPARLFVVNSDEHSVRVYVHDVLGPLLAGSNAMLVLLGTLETFFENGRSVRRSAAALEVHENTVRHRLARVHELTGLDAASDSNDQLSVQTALLVLKLQGHRGLTDFNRRSGHSGSRHRALASPARA